MFENIEIKNIKNLSIDLYFQRMSFSHILFQNLYNDLKPYLKIYNSSDNERRLLIEKSTFEKLLLIVEQNKNELVNLIKLVKMYNQKRFRHIEGVNKYVFLLVSKLKSFLDINNKIIYSKELVVTIDKYFKLINRLFAFLDELCPGFISINENEIDNVILNNAEIYGLNNLLGTKVKAIKLSKFPEVDIVHKVSGLNKDLVFIENEQAYYIVLKNEIEDFIPLAYALILINGFVDDEIIDKCDISESDFEHLEINKVLVHYLSEKKLEKSEETPSVDKPKKDNEIHSLAIKLEKVMDKITSEKINIKKDVFKNNPSVYNSYKGTMDLAKQLLSNPSNSNDSLINKVNTFLDNLDLKIERSKKEEKIKTFYANSVKIDGMKIAKVPLEYRDYNMCLDAVRNNGYAIDFLVNPDEKLIVEAIKQEPRALSVLETKYKTLEVCKTALILNKEMANYIPKEILQEIFS